jgi:prolyl oligopeptidase
VILTKNPVTTGFLTFGASTLKISISLLLLGSHLLIPIFTLAQPARSPNPVKTMVNDPYQWLEDVEGARSIEWVKKQNDRSTKILKARPEFELSRQKTLELLNSKDKIPYFRRIGNFVYNLWTDQKNQRGLWRRTTLAEYQKPLPNWETVLDIDALGQAEKESWTWGGADCFAPDYRRCLISLARGGSDAAVVREFDLTTKSFMAGGFSLPEAKSDLAWKDENTIYVGTDFGEGSMTKSGYPRVIKEWRRGTPLSSAITVFQVKESDVSASASSINHLYGGQRRILFQRSIDFYHNEIFDLQDSQLIKINKPSDAIFSPFAGDVTLKLRSDWQVAGKTYKAGSLLLANYRSYNDYATGKQEFKVLFEPTATKSLVDYSFTREHVILNVLDDVKSRLVEIRLSSPKHIFPLHEQEPRSINLPQNGTIHLDSLFDPSLPDDPLADRYVINYKDFLTPDSLMLGRAGGGERQLLKQLPQRFDSKGMKVEQFFAVSKDKTRVPYFVVSPKGVKTDGSNPTLLYGYGGFQVNQQPWYSGSWGNNWLKKGGVLVLANIRGGGEYGPAWHQAGIKAKKQNSYDDFIAIAEDLVDRKITSPSHLGIMGGSNGGLLVGATFVQRPDLFNAVVCQVPLLDMSRYHRLLAGNSWVAEYGDPDQPAEWDYISRYSPYQNVKKGVKYPKVFFNTSTKDDRVHPAHARKMVAKMLEQGHEVLYFENIEGGHGGAADNNQRATLSGLEFAYLWMQLGTP